MTNTTVSKPAVKASLSPAAYRALVKLHYAGDNALRVSELGIAPQTAKSLKEKGLLRFEKIETGKRGKPPHRAILTSKGKRSAGYAAARANKRAAEAAAKAQADALKLSKALGEALESVSAVN